MSRLHGVIPFPVRRPDASATPAPSQGLALTGATSTRDLVSVALIVLAVGLLALAQSLRRSEPR